MRHNEFHFPTALQLTQHVNRVGPRHTTMLQTMEDLYLHLLNHREDQQQPAICHR